MRERSTWPVNSSRKGTRVTLRFLLKSYLAASELVIAFISLSAEESVASGATRAMTSVNRPATSRQGSVRSRANAPQKSVS